jgi:hypothetical protein
MDTDLFNPARKYKHFRPRQAARGGKNLASVTNLATVALFNNSTGPQVLVVRDILIVGTANDMIATAYVPGQVGASPGLVQPLLPTDALPAGLVTSADTVTSYPADYLLPLSSTADFEWWHDYPFAVVTPGWSFVLQERTSAKAMTVSLLWEAIAIDQLDYFY